MKSLHELVYEGENIKWLTHFTFNSYDRGIYHNHYFITEKVIYASNGFRGSVINNLKEAITSKPKLIEEIKKKRF